MKKAMAFSVLAAYVGCTNAVGAIFQKDSTAHFKVVDLGGSPIGNAAVRVNTLKKWIPGENFGRDVMMDVYGNTDTNGEVDITFPCKSMNFSYSVGKDGYYGMGGGIGFARSGGGFSLRQTQFETNLVVNLKPILNPAPMYVHASYKDTRRHFPGKAASGTWGFDVKYGDWVGPYGKGTTADFFVEYSYEHFRKDRAVDCALVFTNNVCDGFYIAKCTGTRFRSDYAANTNAVFAQRLDFASWGKKYKGNYAVELLDSDEYIVLRTRTRCDNGGRIVSAKYSKIYGPIRFNGMFVHEGSYFNPNENDPNLEADTNVNLMPGGEKGFAP